ncbi:Phosphatidylinositol-glycan biosynthesis class F protein [Frankliniella fusca]|uniref:Phosphatidylinositol-glycan biosynthesis class F protein n=1 Tax=Frankliniella fusca TaxID=407009 RepID=A0AAE1LTQ5_9NEOP|nr:Phosphatidylinositol-glycan biosynthesis class F protein [Frankliniella fusca]
MCLITVAYFIIAVLFGAEFLKKNEETFMLSLLLMMLTALPACLHLGPNYALAAVLGDEKASLNPLSPVLQHIVRVTLLGAWLGAFVIPLDWDRPWQEWPVPCCVGALMGYVAAHATAMIQVAIPRYITSRITTKLH